MTENYIVVCMDEDRYYLATRRVFATHDEATAYAATVAQSRLPLVIIGRFGQLRLPPDQTEAHHELRT